MSDVKELTTKEDFKEQIEYLESLLPHITDRHEYEGTVEVITRLEGRLEALEEMER